MPAELLESLTIKATNETPQPAKEDPVASDIVKEENDDASTAACRLCQVPFQGVEEQRAHVKSDHHKYNLKARIKGTPVMNEAEFNRAIGDLDESISGSESESDYEEDHGEQDAPGDILAALLKKQAKLAPAAENDSVVASKNRNPGRQPVYWFASSLLPKNTYFGIYRALFTSVEQEEPTHLIDSLRKKQTQPIIARGSQAPSGAAAKTPQEQSPHVFLCMIGGGHFAAMVVSLAPEIHKKAGGVEERQARVLAHKTFHRYTTRRKQGGAQSANDAAKGAAHSAGSSLRRYNEAALEHEIRQLLQEWKNLIDQSQLLFVRATGSTNRRILFGPYDGQVLRQNDARLRGFPFSTRRATQSELMRAFTELTRAKFNHIDEASLAAEEEKLRAPASKSPKPPTQPPKPKISKEDEAAMLHTSQIQALIRRSKAPALLSYIANNSITSSFRFFPASAPQNHRCPTPLHLAANTNSPVIVLALLTKARLDPTILNEEGKAAFELCGDRATRDAFRVARYELSDSAWDWEAAHVPTGISKKEADSKGEQEKKAEEDAEAQRRKDEIERLRKEDAGSVSQSKRSSTRMPAAMQKTGAEKREEEMRGMTPEMRMRLERERRARAAEERMRRMQGGGS